MACFVSDLLVEPNRRSYFSPNTSVYNTNVRWSWGDKGEIPYEILVLVYPTSDTPTALGLNKVQVSTEDLIV